MSSLNENRGPALQAYFIAMIVIPTIAVILRFWSRALASPRSVPKRGPRFWWDDWMALATLPFSIATCSMGIYLVSLGLGKHFDTIPPAQELQVLKGFWVSYFLYDTGISLAKSSALLFYARVFNTANKRLKHCLWITQGIVFCWLFALLFTVIFTCIPVEKSWMPMIHGSCQNTEATWLGSAISSIIIDLLILILPLPILWGLQMKRSRKILITCVFVCGYCVILVSLGRLITITRAGPALQEDLTWNSVASLYWLVAETPISILSICLPSIFFIVKRGVRDGPSALFSSHTGSSHANLNPSSPRGTETSLHGSEGASIELHKDSFAESARILPAILGAGTNYQVMATKGSSASQSPPNDSPDFSRPGIHIRSEVDISEGNRV